MAHDHGKMSTGEVVFQLLNGPFYGHGVSPFLRGQFFYSPILLSKFSIGVLGEYGAQACHVHSEGMIKMCVS